MRTVTKQRPSPALVVSVIALVVALAGTATALPGRRSLDKNDFPRDVVGSPAIGANQVKSADVGPNAIRGEDFLNGSLSTAKLADNAVTGDKLLESSLATVPSATNAGTLDGVDSTGFLQTSARGVAVAGARVNATGALLTYFNRAGGAPTVSKAGSDYTIAFPGINVNVNVQLVQATLLGEAGEIDATSLDGNVIVETYNSGGTAADRQFAVFVYDASSTG